MSPFQRLHLGKYDFCSGVGGRVGAMRKGIGKDAQLPVTKKTGMSNKRHMRRITMVERTRWGDKFVLEDDRSGE